MVNAKNRNFSSFKIFKIYFIENTFKIFVRAPDSGVFQAGLQNGLIKSLKNVV